MIFMIIYLFSLLAALGLGLLAAWSDFRGMTIPNFIAILVMVTFFAGYGAAWGAGAEIFSSFVSHLVAGGIIFVITFIMFSARMIGGGDAKLATAFSFWFGLQGIATFLIYMVLAGAVLGGMALVLKKKKLVSNPVEGSWIARVQSGESVVPYGIPIVIGAFAAFAGFGFLSPGTLMFFLVPN